MKTKISSALPIILLVSGAIILSVLTLTVPVSAAGCTCYSSIPGATQGELYCPGDNGQWVDQGMTCGIAGTPAGSSAGSCNCKGGTLYCDYGDGNGPTNTGNSCGGTSATSGNCFCGPGSQGFKTQFCYDNWNKPVDMGTKCWSSGTGMWSSHGGWGGHNRNSRR